MKAILTTNDLKRLVKATAKFVSTDDNRRMLQWIQLKFNKESMSVTAAALDGHKLSVETIKCVSLDEDFTAYIKPHLPVGVKADYSEIEMSGENCLITIGGSIVGYKQPKGEFYNYDKLLSEISEMPIVEEVCLTKDFLVDALKSLQQDELKKLPVTIQLHGDVRPATVKMGKSTRYILPVRKR